MADTATIETDGDDVEQPGDHPRENCEAVEDEDGDTLIYEQGNGHGWIKSSKASTTQHRR